MLTCQLVHNILTKTGACTKLTPDSGAHARAMSMDGDASSKPMTGHDVNVLDQWT